MLIPQLNQPTDEWRSYLRASADDPDAKMRSLAIQRREIKESVYSSSPIPVGREYIDTCSASIENQEGLRQLLADANAGLFTHLAISSIDRLGRDEVEVIKALEALVKAGIIVKMAQIPESGSKTAMSYFQELLFV